MKILIPCFPFSGQLWVAELLSAAFDLEIKDAPFEGHLPGVLLAKEQLEELRLLESGIYVGHSFTARDAADVSGMMTVVVQKEFRQNIVEWLIYDRRDKEISAFGNFRERWKDATDEQYVHLFFESFPKLTEELLATWTMFNHKIYGMNSMNLSYKEARDNPKAVIGRAAAILGVAPDRNRIFYALAEQERRVKEVIENQTEQQQVELDPFVDELINRRMKQLRQIKQYCKL